MDSEDITKLKDRVSDITDMIDTLIAKRERDSMVLFTISKGDSDDLTLEELYAYVDMALTVNEDIISWEGIA